jgi:hypothetical protein
MKAITMRGILIDPKACALTEVHLEADKDHLRQIYDLLHCDTFDCVGLDNADTLYVDDNGIATGSPFHFIVADYPQPLVGRGLILGTNEEGESISAKTTLDDLRARITFMTHLAPGLVALRKGTDTEGHRLHYTKDVFERLEKGEQPC